MDLMEAMDHSVMKNQITEDGNQSKDWNSLLLLLLLTVPTGVMAVVLFLWPDVIWIAELPYTAIGILGAFAAILLSVFIIARYRNRPCVIYISAGLIGMAIINGIRMASCTGWIFREFIFLFIHSFKIQTLPSQIL
jgi:hypothetical protein